MDRQQAMELHSGLKFRRLPAIVIQRAVIFAGEEYMNPEPLTLYKIKPADLPLIGQIAEWYLEEWKIPVEKTCANLQAVASDPGQLQVVLFSDGMPVATGGVYHHVGLLDREPRLKIYTHWLALVYTVPAQRKNGYGATLCRHIQQLSKDMGVENLHLFTDTAEALYQKIGWEVIERLPLGGRDLAIMRMELNEPPVPL